MQIKDYLSNILDKIDNCPYLESQNFSFEEYPPNALYIKGQIIFIYGSRFNYKEFIVFKSAKEDVLKYAYNYLTKDNTLIFRYDNALDPKAKKLSTYPEHKHTQNELLLVRKPTFESVLIEISSLIE